MKQTILLANYLLDGILKRILILLGGMSALELVLFYTKLHDPFAFELIFLPFELLLQETMVPVWVVVTVFLVWLTVLGHLKTVFYDSTGPMLLTLDMPRRRIFWAFVLVTAAVVTLALAVQLAVLAASYGLFQSFCRSEGFSTAFLYEQGAAVGRLSWELDNGWFWAVLRSPWLGLLVPVTVQGWLVLLLVLAVMVTAPVGLIFNHSIRRCPLAPAALFSAAVLLISWSRWKPADGIVILAVDWLITALLAIGAVWQCLKILAVFEAR